MRGGFCWETANFSWVASDLRGYLGSSVTMRGGFVRRLQNLCWAASNLKATLGSRVVMRSGFVVESQENVLGFASNLNGDSGFTKIWPSPHKPSSPYGQIFVGSHLGGKFLCSRVTVKFAGDAS